jgi:hypothetical protein
LIEDADLPIIRPSNDDGNGFESAVRVVALVYNDAVEAANGKVVSADPEEEEEEEVIGGIGMA